MACCASSADRVQLIFAFGPDDGSSITVDDRELCQAQLSQSPGKATYGPTQLLACLRAFPSARVTLTKGLLMSLDGVSELIHGLSACAHVELAKPLTFEVRNASHEQLNFLLGLLIEGKQFDLFECFPGMSQQERESFLSMLEHKHASHSLKRFRQAIEQNSSAQLKHIEPVPNEQIVDLPYCCEEYFRYERLAKQLLCTGPSCGFILVAGGLGERLGANQIKISLPTESLTGITFVQVFLAHLLEYNHENPPPLFIMTSDDTHQRTLECLDKMTIPQVMRDRISLCKQDSVISFSNSVGKIATKPNPDGTLVLKPHGHGDVHTLFANSGLFDKWQTEFNVKHLVFFQDTNPNCFRCLPILIGVLEDDDGTDFAIATIPRIPKSATGCIAMSKSKDDCFTIENFEYNIVNSIKGLDDSQLKMGNTNQFVIRASAYQRLVLNKPIPEFCNPKYAANRVDFTSPARLECLMQDCLQFFSGGAVKVVLFQDFAANRGKTHVLYAPAKNSLALAKKAWDAGTVDGSPASSEAALYASNCGLLQSVGCQVDCDMNNAVRFGLAPMELLPFWPCITFHPNTLAFWSDVRQMFPHPQRIHIGPHSSLELKGPGRIVIDQLDLDGSLIVWAKTKDTVLHLTKLSVKNSGRSVESVENEARLQVTHSSQVTVVESDQAGIVQYSSST